MFDMRRRHPLTRFAAACLVLAAVCTLPGCGSAKDIQSLAYVTAMGIDYVDGKYVTYAQVLNFSNVARTENGELGKKVPVWLGIGHGVSITESFSDMNTTSQFPLFMGHLKTIVMSERAMRRGVKELYLTLNRYREIRYNVYVYGTKDNLSDILTQKSIFNLSPLDTTMFSGTQMDSDLTFLLPLSGNRGIANVNEPGITAMIPDISSSDKTWHEDKLPRSMSMVKGAFFLEEDRAFAWMSVSDLQGVRWSNRNLNHTPLQLPRDDGYKDMVMFVHPRMKLKIVKASGEPRFDITVRVKGTVYEMRNTPIAEMERRAEKAIEDEIRETYRKALRKRCDPFQLEELLYRKHPAVFRKLTSRDRFFLDEASLRSVHVHASITSTGKYNGNIK
ncbi:Ger(x)C family spore germination protein [Paenibacillus lycopersici]|nr:Ger(x)C family spore germination protein [Paenibacillus lycopersici]